MDKANKHLKLSCKLCIYVDSIYIKAYTIDLLIISLSYDSVEANVELYISMISRFIGNSLEFNNKGSLQTFC